MNRTTLNGITNIDLNFNSQNRIILFNGIKCTHTFINIGSNQKRFCIKCFRLELNNVLNTLVQAGRLNGVFYHLRVVNGIGTLKRCVYIPNPFGFGSNCIYCNQFIPAVLFSNKLLSKE